MGMTMVIPYVSAIAIRPYSPTNTSTTNKKKKKQRHHHGHDDGDPVRQRHRDQAVLAHEQVNDERKGDQVDQPDGDGHDPLPEDHLFHPADEHARAQLPNEEVQPDQHRREDGPAPDWVDRHSPEA